MDIPFSRWYPVIEERRSRRRFETDRTIEPDKLAALDNACKHFAPFPEARSCLVIASPKNIFKGIVGSYGKIRGTTTFIAFVGNMDSPSVQEKVGYTGEGIILEATTLGLSTCWVAGSFKPESVNSIIELNVNERVLAVTPVGYSGSFKSFEEKLTSVFLRSHRRLPVARLVSKTSRGDLPEWINASIQAARLAPSAINRQPWGFDIGDNSVTVYVRTGGLEYNVSKRLDCGIAMLHFEVAALNFGIKGEWQFLNAPQVARFHYK